MHLHHLLHHLSRADINHGLGALAAFCLVMFLITGLRAMRSHQ